MFFPDVPRCSLFSVDHPLHLHLHNDRRRPARHERTVRLSRLVSFHPLILCAARNATRLAPGMAPVLLADAGILATSFMHTHKSVPIADLPHRVPHLRNCRPSALEVILQIPVRRRPNVCASSHLLHDPPWTSLSFFTQSTPMVVGVLHLHQRHALAQWSV